MSELRESRENGKVNFAFDNSYARLPEHFFQRILPVPVEDPELVCLNRGLFENLGLDPASFEGKNGAAIFSGNLIPPGAEPIALAYAGHQFGHFVPQLGDGRAVLLGENLGLNGKRWDIQLKGSGQTAFSRRGDGRAALGPVIREYLVSEALHALGVPTNRSLALVVTGEKVYREDVLPGAILTRLASSHVRVGTFEFFAARNDITALKLLADYTIDRLYPEIRNIENRYLALLNSVVDAQASLIARWMQIGFIHGVMNTDNMAISGETIDYGPCAFMDDYDPMRVFSSIDHLGRYAYSNQSKIGQWNLASLAECLVPLIDQDREKASDMAKEVVDGFLDKFSMYWLEGMGAKLGLNNKRSGDVYIVQELLGLMHIHEADYHLVFRQLCDLVDGKSETKRLNEKFFGDTAWDDWLVRWQKRLQEESRTLAEIAKDMRGVNPVFIPRNHLVERAINFAVEENDFSVMQTLQDLTTNPFTDNLLYAEFSEPPQPNERVFQTFCGT